MQISRTWSAWLGLTGLLGVLSFTPRAGAAVSVNVGSPTGKPGDTVRFFVTLTTTAGEQVAGAQTTVDFEPETPVVQCTPNPAFVLSLCALHPTGCTPGVNCLESACFVAPFGGTISSGSQLYFCDVHIGSNVALGEYALRCTAVDVRDSAGHSLNPQCTDGQVEVVSAPTVHVCDAVGPDDTGSDFGQFGDGKVSNSDVVAIFKASLLTPPLAGSALFEAMDAVSVDAPPTCGGDKSIQNSDVVACFRRSLLGGAGFTRTFPGGTSGMCTSAQQ
jgi:hypothetical protein